MTATTLTGLPLERFVSKRDAWLVAVLWGASLAAIDSIEPGFLRALAQRAPQLEVSGESARRRR